jgi:hypothetical protein
MKLTVPSIVKGWQSGTETHHTGSSAQPGQPRTQPLKEADPLSGLAQISKPQKLIKPRPRGATVASLALSTAKLLGASRVHEVPNNGRGASGENTSNSLKRSQMQRQFAGGAASMPNTGVSRVPPQQREMNQVSYTASHVEFGQLTVEQDYKSASDSKVSFRLQLQTPDGRNVSVTQEMTAENENPTYTNRSTFGYDVVELPEAMQGQAIGYFVQYVAAHAAIRLGAQRVIVDAVSNERMNFLVRKVGMTNKGAIDESCYSGDPNEVARRSLARLNAHGWLID